MRLCRFLSRKPRCIQIVAPLRLDVETAKPEQLRIGARAHVAEGALGRDTVAGHLRRLRGQQQRERIARRKPRRIGGGPARQAQVASTDCDQTSADGKIAFDGAPMAEEQ